MKKISKADSKKFFTELNKFILNELNGVETDNIGGDSDINLHIYEIDTIVGKMGISLDETQEYVYTVFCRFEDVFEAKLKFPCNPYSGKYNLHFSAIPIKEAIEVAKQHLEICKG